LNLIQEDRAVFCTHGPFASRPRPASSIGSLAMSRRTCSAACVISITN
jgi:hypothetical protein